MSSSSPAKFSCSLAGSWVLTSAKRDFYPSALTINPRHERQPAVPSPPSRQNLSLIQTIPSAVM